MSANQAINDKLQGSVATYLRYGMVVNNQIRKGLWLSLSVIFLNRQIFGKVTSKNVIVSSTFFVFYQCVGKACKVNETITFLLKTFFTHRQRDRLAWRSLQSPECGTNLEREVPKFMRYPNLLITQCGVRSLHGSLHAKIQLDSSSRFDAITASDKQTGRRTDTDRQTDTGPQHVPC